MKDQFSSASIAILFAITIAACAAKPGNSNGGAAGAGSGPIGAPGTGGAPVMGSGGAPAMGSGGGVAMGSGGVSGGAGGASGSGGMAAPLPGGGGAGWQMFMDTVTADKGTVERGQYLVDHVLNCGVCHTPSLPTGEPDKTLYLAGSRSYDFTDVDGTIITVNAENLTSHNPEGLAAWSDGQIRTAITKGVDDEHYAIYPIMPYPEYSLLTPEDADSIIQYLRTVPPNDNVVAADFPHADINAPAPLVDDTMIPHTTLAMSDPDYAAAERGRYLAKVACLNCHTEEVQHDAKIMPDVPELTKAFAGGKKYTFIRGAMPNTSVNLTPDATGLKDWTVADIVAALKTNTEKGTGRTLCNTHPGGPERIGAMTDADLTDLATYIHTLPPVQNGPFTCVPAMQ